MAGRLALPSRRRGRGTLVGGVATIHDEQYAGGDADTLLDVYFPLTACAGRDHLATIVWIHGGAYVAGRKDHDAPYFARLAAAGFTVVSVEYARAPRARYPTPILQIDAAVAYAMRHAARFRVDDRQMFLAGDSAGAQIASQIAALVTNPGYAGEMGITPSLTPAQLRGVVLFGGVYDGKAIARHDGTVANLALQLFTTDVLWAYTGARGGEPTAVGQMSTIDHVTADFPPTFVCGGNADPFTAVHSQPFATRLVTLGVDVSVLFFDPDAPPLPHQFQFDLEREESRATMSAVVAFLKRLAR